MKIKQYKIYKKEEYHLGDCHLGDWCYVKIALVKNNLSGKYEVEVLAWNDLLKKNLRYQIIYKELKFATICYDNWRNKFIGETNL